MPADGGSLRVQARVSRGAAGFALDVDFEAPPGVTVLFGPSGSGKSTTLAVVAGLVRPASGRVAIGDTPWFDADAGVDVPVHRRGVAYVFQSPALFPHMTAIGNVVYGMDRAVERRVREARARALLERLRAGHLAERRPATFSGGEAQRVALARALATSPRAILLDEPFSALDRELRIEMMTDLRAMVHEREREREREVPVIFVTHGRDEARAFGERVVVLAGGRVDRTCTVGDLGQ